MRDLMRSVCVFAGSGQGNDSAYREVARALGHELGRRGITMVYGGGRIGLMGVAADAALAANGEVVGVIPEQLAAAELAHEGVSQLHVVGSMHERKALMEQLSGGFVALPGGFGTMDELFETLTLIQTKKVDPIPVILFGRDYWNRAIHWDTFVEEGTIAPHDLELISFAESAQEAWQIVLDFYANRPQPKLPRGA